MQDTTKRMRLTEWADAHGVTRRTARQMLDAGSLPPELDPAKIGRRWFVRVVEPSRQRIVLYARVSSHDQRADLQRQKLRLLEYAQTQRLVVDDVVTETGSGLNGKRPKLLQVLKDPMVGTLVVEHRDRLARFGVEMIEAMLHARGGRLVVLEERELDDDLVRDMTDVMTSLCTRLYGRRSARRRAERAVRAAGGPSCDDERTQPS